MWRMRSSSSRFERFSRVVDDVRRIDRPASHAIVHGVSQRGVRLCRCEKWVGMITYFPRYPYSGSGVRGIMTAFDPLVRLLNAVDEMTVTASTTIRLISTLHKLLLTFFIRAENRTRSLAEISGHNPRIIIEFQHDPKPVSRFKPAPPLQSKPAAPIGALPLILVLRNTANIGTSSALHSRSKRKLVAIPIRWANRLATTPRVPSSLRIRSSPRLPSPAIPRQHSCTARFGSSTPLNESGHVLEELLQEILLEGHDESWQTLRSTVDRPIVVLFTALICASAGALLVIAAD